MVVVLKTVVHSKNFKRGGVYGRIDVTDLSLASLVGKRVYVVVIPEEKRSLLMKIMQILEEELKETP